MPKRLSLHPLSFEDALANLIKVKPAGKGKKSRQKSKAVRQVTRKRKEK